MHAFTLLFEKASLLDFKHSALIFKILIRKRIPSSYTKIMTSTTSKSRYNQLVELLGLKHLE